MITQVGELKNTKKQKNNNPPNWAFFKTEFYGMCSIFPQNHYLKKKLKSACDIKVTFNLISF